jgi:hypothetical protein
MHGGKVHYELYVRRTPQAPWRLELASEDRAHALASAEICLTEQKVAAVRVTKETLNEDTREFASSVVMTKGEVADTPKKAVRQASAEPPCVTPSDLYSSHPRETIGRLLADWLKRNRAVPFELLHRPDLAEKLEAAGMDLQHAIQKIAVPESQHSGAPIHEVMRAYQKLTEASLERLIQHGRAKSFPNLNTEKIGAAALRLASHPERVFLLGGGVAAYISDAKSWREKVDRLLDLMDQAPEAAQPRALCQVVIEQPLGEILASHAGLTDLFGGEVRDLGDALTGLARIAANQEVEALITFDRNLAKLMPTLQDAAQRLSERLAAGEFKLLGAVLARRILSELSSTKRLRPSDPSGEIDILRALAMVLTATAGRLLTIEEVHEGFVARSKALVAGDFVDAYLAGSKSAMAEAHALIRLCENVAGGANKRQAARFLTSCVGALKFESELRSASESAPARLGALAELQRAVVRVNLPEIETREVNTRIGQVGGMVEADTKIIAQLGRSGAPLIQKLNALLKLATGEAAPVGPVSDRARAEVFRLAKAPESRAEIAAAPEVLAKLKSLLAA